MRSTGSGMTGRAVRRARAEDAGHIAAAGAAIRHVEATHGEL